MNMQRIGALLLLILFLGTAYTQEDAPVEEEVAGEEAVPAEPIPLPEDVAAAFQERLNEINLQQEMIDELERRAESSEGVLRSVHEARMDAVWSSMFDNTLNLATDVAARFDEGYEVSATAELLSGDLEVYPTEAIAAMERLGRDIVFPTDDLPPAEIVIQDKRLLGAVNRYDAILASLVTYTKIAESLDIEASEARQFLMTKLPDSAANRSVYLQLTQRRASITRSAATALPQNPDLPARVLAAESQVGTASKTLQETVRLMNAMGLETRQYRQQLLTATGEVTADVLDVGVVAGLLKEWGRALYSVTKTEGPRLLFSVLLFLLIVWVAYRVASLVRTLTEKALAASNVRLSHLLKRMIISSARNLILILGVLIALSQVGVSLGPLLAGLGIAGFIIGFALQDSLANFASGMMILVYRPFDVGDFVEAGGVTGRVDRMSLVNSTFKTFDNQVIVVPNNLIWQSVIKNLTAQTTRRVDLTFGISYGDDIDKAKAILKDVVENYDSVLDDPEPNIRVTALGESSVDLICRPWVKTADYWDTYWDLTEIVKKRFDKEGITIPFPQRDVHTFNPGKS